MPAINETVKSKGIIYYRDSDSAYHSASRCRFAKYLSKKYNQKGHQRRWMSTQVNYMNTSAKNEDDNDEDNENV